MVIISNDITYMTTTLQNLLRTCLQTLTLAIVPSTEYPVTIMPFRESGAHSSSSSRLGPDCTKPGLARTTHGGPSATLRSQPLACGTLVIYLS